MSLGRGVVDVLVRRFPRVSGDEPGVTDALAADRMFSPRERG